MNLFYAKLILIFYGIILSLIFIYCFHRLYLLYLFFKNYKKIEYEDNKFENIFPKIPIVTIQIPIYNEFYVVKRIIDAVTALDYPVENLDIQILDDSDDETKNLISNICFEKQKQGIKINHIHRKNRSGFKAGALMNGLKIAKGDFIAIFDADFVPPKNIIKKLIIPFVDEKVGMVQSRWTHLNRKYSLLTKFQSLLLDGHFIIEHTARYSSGMFFNFNGTAGLWRKKAIIDSGGFQSDTLTEDMDLSYRAQLVGWKFVYRPDVECPAEIPMEMNAFKSQQKRWTKGAVQTGKKVLPTIWKSNLPFLVKLESTFHMGNNFSYVFIICAGILLGPAYYCRYILKLNVLPFIDIMILIVAIVPFILFYLITESMLQKKYLKVLIQVPFVLSFGVGISLNNGFAALSGLFNEKAEFIRTAKYGVIDNFERWKNKIYQPKYDFGAIIELLLGIYFLIILYFVTSWKIYLAIPLVGIFMTGFLYFGLISILHSK